MPFKESQVLHWICQNRKIGEKQSSGRHCAIEKSVFLRKCESAHVSKSTLTEERITGWQ